MQYHAHVYWKSDLQREFAIELYAQLTQLGYKLGRVWDNPIGPHPLPMYQVMYSSNEKTKFEDFLNKNNTCFLSILLHEDVGIDHVKDHTVGARWIGTPLELNLEFLRNIED